MTRHAFYSAAETAHRIAMRNRTALSVITIDIDDFKRINDTFGHPSGDRVLQCVAEILRAIAGSDIYVARTGGEEFALITDGVSEASVAALAERIRASIESYDFIDRRTAENLGPVTVSLGMCMAAEANSPGDLYALQSYARTPYFRAGNNHRHPAATAGGDGNDNRRNRSSCASPAGHPACRTKRQRQETGTGSA
jgi:diguanylate cyclase (GGDEF)-like protein